MAKQTSPAPQQEQSGDVVAEKKRRKWPWVLGGIGVIAAIIVLTAVSTDGGGGSTGADSAAPGEAVPGEAEPGEAAPTATVTIYEIESEGDGSAMVTYTTDENLSVSQENGVALPWTKTVDLGQGTVFGGASLTAQGDASVTSITCRVMRDGEVVAENTSTGRYAVVTCS